MSEPVDDLPDHEFAAADYALGTLDRRERAAAERRLRRDPGFRAEVEAWQARLGPLAQSVEAVPPPAALWPAIERELPQIRPASPPVRPPREGLVPAFWRWLALGSGALAAGSLAALVLFAMPPGEGLAPSDGARFAATTITSDANGLPIFAVVLDPSTQTATLVPIRLDAGPGQVPELWIAREGGAPQSLGVFDPSVPLRIALDPGQISGDLSGSRLAISLEPTGGSPTGQPTGPVIGHGRLSEI